MFPMHPRPIRFRPNPQKALEVILWCANKRGQVDFHTVLKVLFAADIAHLNEYGRPIVGDSYMALPFGPVPQATYDIMKREPLMLEQLGQDQLPFTVTGYRLKPQREADMSQLSQSEVEALEEGWRQYGGLSFSQRTELSHQHPAWQNAVDAGKQLMDYADFLDSEHRTPEHLADLAEAAPLLRI